jgi:hypothetical protein
LVNKTLASWWSRLVARRRFPDWISCHEACSLARREHVYRITHRRS